MSCQCSNTFPANTHPCSPPCTQSRAVCGALSSSEQILRACLACDRTLQPRYFFLVSCRPHAPPTAAGGRRRHEQAHGGAQRGHGGGTEKPGAGKETLCESCSDRVDRKTNPKAGTRRTLTWPERKRSGAQRMGAAASAGRSAGYGIGVVDGRGKAGTIEFGKSVITDDDAFQSSQRDPHRKSGKASSRSPRSGADDTKSSKVRKVLPRIHVRHASVCVCVFVSPPAVFDVRHSRSEHAYTRALVAHPAE